MSDTLITPFDIPIPPSPETSRALLSAFAERRITFMAEREVKSIETASRCSDGGWTFDGTTLRFSREIATTAPDRPMPLVLRFKS